MHSTGKEWVTFKLRSMAGAIALAFAVAPPASADDAYSAERLEMVGIIEAIAHEVGGGSTPSDLDKDVLDAMRRTERHAFVPTHLRRLAYADRPLPIGYGQTISQPYIVALMTDLLHLPPGGRALEIGTGSGYQAAVLAELGNDVYSIEIVPALAKEAAERLSDLGYKRVRVKEGDGYFGWPDAAPFDGIVVTAAAHQIPPPLIDQLKPGGRMIIPVGAAFLTQQLMLVEKLADGTVRTEALLPVSFVPLTRSQ